MGAMCKKGHRFLQDGETCTYCEAPPTGGQREYAVFNLDLGPVIKVPLEEVGQKYKTPIDMGPPPRCVDSCFCGKTSLCGLGQSEKFYFPPNSTEWHLRDRCGEGFDPRASAVAPYVYARHPPINRRIGFSALSPAGRLDAVQGMLAPKNSLGEPLPPLCTVDEAKKFLDIPAIPLQWQDRAGFNLHGIPVVVSQYHRGPPTIICAPKDYETLQMQAAPTELQLSFRAEFEKIEQALVEHIEKMMKTYAFHVSPAAAMETTPPLQTEDAHGAKLRSSTTRNT